MFKNSFLTKHLWVTVSVISKKEILITADYLPEALNEEADFQ